MKWIHRLLIVLAICSIQTIFAQESENLLNNPGFESGRSGWVIKDFNEADASYKIDDTVPISETQSLQVTVTTGGNAEDVQVYRTLTLETGRIYTISFMVKSDVPASIKAAFYNTTEETYIWTSPDVATTETATVAGPFEFNCMEPDKAYRFMLQLGGTDQVVYTLDSVVITQRDNPDHLRDEEKFEYGEHTVNGTTIPYRFFPIRWC